uniref:COesterase domain-containing protein n=1 Tax=Angiostrongylus cantonensis TaxID=6313 RepID=A0A0K0DBG6_ANGCA
RIPYATPPIRDLRFEKPRPPQKWAGIRDATEYGPACMSNSSMTTSPQKWIDEDCLHVNIFAGVDCLVSDACPVVFYIHGGGFNYDSAVMFNDEFLINNFGGNDVVLVIPGVRLGFFGLLNFDDEDVVPANIAAYDLIAALQFVQKDIKPFGGNPDDVTLFGHSQGATTVAQFLFSKEIDPSRKVSTEYVKWRPKAENSHGNAMCHSHQNNRFILIMRHSSLLFIFGFLELIQNASRVPRACVLGSCTRHVLQCRPRYVSVSYACLVVYLVYVCRLGVLYDDIEWSARFANLFVSARLTGDQINCTRAHTITISTIRANYAIFPFT